MKNAVPSAIIISALLALSVYADEASVPRITVFGTATTEVVPNQMVWSLQVENKGDVLETVAREHTKSVQKVLEFLNQSKVDPKALQTSRMRFSENWEYRANSRVREGYVASTEISFKTTDLELYVHLWLGLAGMPVVSVQSVTYDHTGRIDFQNQTRDKAILAAKEKAAASAKTLGAEIGAPLLLEEVLSPSEGWQMTFENNLRNTNIAAEGGEGRGSPEGLAPGTIPIRIRVKAAFQLLPHK
ncbi:MAG: SIMPL domain-containing protein [Verrucomicrobiota bacterium]